MSQSPRKSRRSALSLGVATLATSGVALAAAAALGRDSEAMTKPDLASDKARADLLASFVGMKLRVVGPGEVVTMEYNPDRLTVGIDGEKRIKQIYIG